MKAFVEFFERIVTLLQVQKQKSLLAKSCETYEGIDYSLSTGCVQMPLKDSCVLAVSTFGAFYEMSPY